jgi:hypothetical protein
MTSIETVPSGLTGVFVTVAEVPPVCGKKVWVHFKADDCPPQYQSGYAIAYPEQSVWEVPVDDLFVRKHPMVPADLWLYTKIELAPPLDPAPWPIPRPSDEILNATYETCAMVRDLNAARLLTLNDDLGFTKLTAREAKDARRVLIASMRRAETALTWLDKIMDAP